MIDPPSTMSPIALGAVLGTAILTAATVRAALAYLRHRQILDMPNSRSSHERPTPRGGGLGAIPPLILLLGAAIWVGWLPGRTVWPLLAATLLFAISFLDDLRNLPAGPRLLAHVAAAGIALAGLPPTPIVLPDGPVWFWLDRGVALLALVWWLNLYNFMDGIDGISGVETASLGLGLAFLTAAMGAGATGSPVWIGWIGLVLAGAALGFLFWNWHPAKLFLGDVGSIPFGLLTGFALFALAQAGGLAAAILLSLTYAVDATATLLRRARAGEKVWEAHRSHAYQRAVQSGLSHADVSRRIAVWNVVLFTVALASLGQPAWIQAVQVALGLAATLAFLRHLAQGGRFRL